MTVPADIAAVLEGTAKDPEKAQTFGRQKNRRRYAVRRGGGMTDLFPEVVTSQNPEAEIDERYTQRATLAFCADLAGVERFDLDVSATAESAKAPSFFTKEQDGLRHGWAGRVWCNPPYSDVAPWVEKAWNEAEHCEVIAMLLPANRTEQPWWQMHVEPFRDGRGLAAANLTTHALPGRPRFGMPGNPEGVGVGSPPFGVVLLVWRRSPPQEVVP